MSWARSRLGRGARAARACTLALLAWSLHAGAAAPPLRLLVTTGASLPFADISPGSAEARLLGGIVHDWGLALAQRLGREPRFLLMPARRVGQQLREGSFDVQCFENPQWYGPQDEAWIEWLPRPLMEVVEELVSMPGTPLVRHLEQLQGKTVGVVTGYRYPLLDPLFEAGRMERSLAHNETRLLQMQRLGRADYSVISRLQLDYARATDPKLRTLIASPLVVSRTALYCLRLRSSPIPLSELAAAQQALLNEGRLEAILQRYR
ncbi:ABC transporter substrate-binding protein [Mitsuaria sp. WAJ17]|uniref:substrate-binding periplasmic protein n=1 Tax=Mitsuaria sp. WAJ17 TaxID=2761452 RepID=UPI0015FF92B6|nr:ABC transporter substrate-binding protein [Mitsuaria sp. WAJ17]MBB2483738.1 ABC transporter substrate-binding protein [Mitsuaria sp. WAJ17]